MQSTDTNWSRASTKITPVAGNPVQTVPKSEISQYVLENRQQTPTQQRSFWSWGALALKGKRVANWWSDVHNWDVTYRDNSVSLDREEVRLNKVNLQSADSLEQLFDIYDSLERMNLHAESLNARKRSLLKRCQELIAEVSDTPLTVMHMLARMQATLTSCATIEEVLQLLSDIAMVNSASKEEIVLKKSLLDSCREKAISIHKDFSGVPIASSSSSSVEPFVSPAAIPPSNGNVPPPPPPPPAELFVQAAQTPFQMLEEKQARLEAHRRDVHGTLQREHKLEELDALSNITKSLVNEIKSVSISPPATSAPPPKNAFLAAIRSRGKKKKSDSSPASAVSVSSKENEATKQESIALEAQKVPMLNACAQINTDIVHARLGMLRHHVSETVGRKHTMDDLNALLDAMKALVREIKSASIQLQLRKGPMVPSSSSLHEVQAGRLRASESLPSVASCSSERNDETHLLRECGQIGADIVQAKISILEGENRNFIQERQQSVEDSKTSRERIAMETQKLESPAYHAFKTILNNLNSNTEKLKVEEDLLTALRQQRLDLANAIDAVGTRGEVGMKLPNLETHFIPLEIYDDLIQDNQSQIVLRENEILRLKEAVQRCSNELHPYPPEHPFHTYPTLEKEVLRMKGQVDALAGKNVDLKRKREATEATIKGLEQERDSYRIAVFTEANTSGVQAKATSQPNNAKGFGISEAQLTSALRRSVKYIRTPSSQALLQITRGEG